MITKCPKCEATLNVAGGYDRIPDPVEGKVQVRLVCHQCGTEFTPKYNGSIGH